MLVGINKNAIAAKNLNSKVTVENGGTASLGVFFRLPNAQIRSSSPHWATPLIGRLFRHKSKLQDKTELQVFLTPTILDKP